MSGVFQPVTAPPTSGEEHVHRWSHRQYLDRHRCQSRLWPAVAVALAATGADVVGVARDESALEDLQRQLGPSFTPVVADVADGTLASHLISKYRPRILVLNAGATPHAATLQDQTWKTFSENWNVDVRHVFDFAREALVAPLEPGSAVVSLSSGAARMGSPMSGGYAGSRVWTGDRAASSSSTSGGEVCSS